MTDALDGIRRALERAGLGHESLQVFGRARINVHVTCVSRDTAEKWRALLAGGVGPCSVTPTMWAAKNQAGGTCLRPAMRRGWLVAAVGPTAAP